MTGNTINKESYLSLETYATSYDFYQIVFPNDQQINTGDELVFTITNNIYPITEMAFNQGSLPVTGFESNNCATSRNTQEHVLVVDYCTLIRIASDLTVPSFLAVQPDSAVRTNYTLSWEWRKASPLKLTPNVQNSEVYNLFDNEIVYFEFPVTENDETFLNTTIQNIQGGSVDFVISWNELPFISCLDNSCDTYLSNCCLDVDTSCELLVPECRVASGTYYLGVKAISLDDDTKPLSFQLQADISETPYASQIKTGLFYTGSVHQAHTDFYEFEVENQQDSTFEVHLYIDQNEPDQSGRITTLYVNAENPAGANNTCWSNIAACEITDAGACSVQINPCRYAQFDSWYVSVFGGNTTTYYGTPVDYTLMAKLSAPTLLNTPFLVNSYTSFANEYKHFHLSESLIEDGGQASLVFYEVSGGELTVYLNMGGLAGPTNTCPICYNYTQTRTATSEQPLVWTIANCNSTINDNRDSIFFSVASTPSNGQSSVDYTLLLTAANNEIKPLDTLEEGQVMVDLVGPQTSMNYTIEGADGADSYLEVKLVQVNTNGLNPLSLAVYNTSQLNCIGDVYSVVRPTILNTLSIIIDPCHFNTSESDWLIQVINPNDASVHYNLEYIIHSTSPRQMSSAETYASELTPGIVDQFSYSMNGDGTVIIEVYYDDHQSALVQGQLFVSLEGTPGPSSIGANDCYYNDFEQSDAERCAWAATSCRFEEGDTVYFAVGSVGLPFGDSLGYTIQVTEINAVNTVTANTTLSDLVYSGQSAFYTFNVDQQNVATSGSRIVVEASNEQNGEINLFLAQSSSPFASGSCPCFEYGSELEIDYCHWEENSATWTVLAQANPTNDNEPVAFTLTISQEMSTPTEIQVGSSAATVGNVMQDQYKYYTLTGLESSTHLYVSVSKIDGGAITVFFNNDGPATSQCRTASQCDGETDSCLFELSTACIGVPQYLSVYGENADSASPINFEIQVFDTTLTTLADGQSAAGSLKPAFTRLYSLNVNDTSNMISPELTITVSGASSNSTGVPVPYSIALYAEDTCAAQAVVTTNCVGTDDCTMSVSPCELSDSYYVSIQNDYNVTINYNIVQSVQDLAAGETQLTEGVVSNITLTPFSTASYVMRIPSTGARQSLSWTVQADQPGVNLYFNEDTATPECYATSARTQRNQPIQYNVNVCQLEVGDYRLFVENNQDVDVTATVVFNLENVIANATDLGTLNANGTSRTFTIDHLETQEFKFTMEPTSVYAAWYISAEVVNDTSAGIYLQTVSAAGNVAQEYCLTSSFADTGSLQQLSLQCELDGDSYAQLYEGGTFYLGVTNNNADSQELTLNVLLEMTEYVPLTDGVAVQFELGEGPSYFSFDTETTRVSQDLQIVIETTSTIASTLSGGDACGRTVTSCPPLNGGNCTLTQTLCQFDNWNNMYSLNIQGTPGDSVTVTASLVDHFSDVNSLNAGAVALSGNSVNSYNASTVGHADFGVLTVTFTGNAQLGLSYYLEESGQCASTVNWDCTQDGNDNTCTYTVEPCQFYEGMYYFDITANPNTNYTLQFSVVTETVTVLDAPQVVVGSLFPGQIDYYSIRLDRSKIKAGQSLNVSLEASCGEATLYLNYGSDVASPQCSQTTGSSIDISSCTLLALPPASAEGEYFNIAVSGGAQAYPDLDLPSQYVLEVAASGPVVTFSTVGASQAIPYNWDDTIYVFPVPGLDDFVGELVIDISNAAGTLIVSFDQPPFPVCDTLEHLLQTNEGETNSLVLNACDLEGVRQIYLVFEPESEGDSIFQINHVKPFIRDLNEYNSVPQSGAVVPRQGLVNTIVDQEYYRITPDFTNTNYTISFWLENAVDGVQLLVSQGSVPSYCSRNDDNVIAVGPTTNVTFEWCDLEDGEDIFLSVNYPSTQGSSNVAYSYDLYWSAQSVPATALSNGQSICDTLPGQETNVYVLSGSQPASNMRTTLTVYALAGDCTLDVAWNTTGSASTACGDTARCDLCNTAASNCTFDLSCAPAGSVYSVAVSNPNDDEVDYFIVWNQTPVSADAVAVDAPQSGTAGATYFSVNLPQITTSSQYAELVVIPEDEIAEDFNMYFSSGHLPSADCSDYDGVTSIVFNSCDYPTNPAYLLVESTGKYRVEIQILSPTQTTLSLDTFYESEFSPSADDTTVMETLLLTIADTDVSGQALTDLAISVYGVHQGQVALMVGNMELGADCVMEIVPVIANEGSLVIPYCELVPGQYFINVVLVQQFKEYTPVTFGVMATLGQSGAAIQQLDGSAVTGVFPAYTKQFYSFTPASESSVIEITFSTESSFDITATLINLGGEVCEQQISEDASYFWNCNGMKGEFYILLETSGNTSPLPVLPTFTLQVQEYTPTTLSNTPTAVSFAAAPYTTTRFFQFAASANQSTQIEVGTNGAVFIELWSNTCDDTDNNSLFQFACYESTCLIPFSWDIGIYPDVSQTFYLSVQGFAPTEANVTLLAGQANTCVQPEPTDLCDITWSVWNYGTGDQGFAAQEAASLRLYNQLVDAFCPPCGCPEISKSCNESLIEYVCTETYRACDSNGMQASVCQDTCFDVQENCGYTFEEVGLPLLACNHNSYYTGNDDICTDVYGITVTDGTDTWLWIVIAVVAVVAILIIAGVIGFLAFKKFKHGRQTSTYESISGIEED